MATFEITGPDGETYEITAPDGATEDQVLQYAQQQFGGEAAKDLKSLPPPVKQIAVGEEAAAKAMEEELASRNWREKLLAGIGSALQFPAMRAEQAVTGLTPAKQEELRRWRQITATPEGMVGNIVGTTAMLGPAAGRLAGAAQTLPGAARIAAAAPRASRIGALAGAGAGMITATQPTLPGESEAAQAAIGAAGGVAGGAAVKGAGYLAQGAKALMRSFAGPEAKVGRETVQRLTQAMEADGLNPAEVMGKAADLAQRTGRPVTLGDVVGEDVTTIQTPKGLQEALSTAEGPGRAALLRGIEKRSTGQQARVLEDVAETLGTSKLARSEAFEGLAKAKSAAAQPLYDRAFADPTPILDENLTTLFERPSMQTALREGIKDAAERGEPMHTIPYSGEAKKLPKALLSGEEFSPGVQKAYAPTVQMLDKVKKKLDRKS